MIFAFGTANSARAADAVALGLVASISRPGGQGDDGKDTDRVRKWRRNVTGVSFVRVLILDLLGVLVLTWEMEIPNTRSCRCSSSQKL